MSEDVKRTPSEWEEIDKIKILDPDGWRKEDAPSWDTPISYSEWRQRMSVSTCSGYM